MNRDSTSFEKSYPDEDPPARFASYLDTIYDNRKLIGVITAIVLAFGVAYAFLAQPVYSTDMLVQVEQSADTATSRNALGDVSSMFDVKTAALSETQVIGSRSVVSQVVDKMHLYIEASPRYVPVIGRWIAEHSDAMSTPGPFGYAWSKERIEVSQFDVPRELYGRTFVLTKCPGRAFDLSYRDIKLSGAIGDVLQATTIHGPVKLLVDSIDAETGATFVLRRLSPVITTEKLRKELTIEETDKGSNVISVSLTGTDPQKISAILGAIGAEYVSQNMRRKSAEAERSLQFLQLQLPDLKERLDASETRLNTYRAAHGTVNLGEEATSLLQRSISAQTKLTDLEKKRQELLSRFTEDHPAVRSVDAQIQVAQREADDVGRATRLLPPLEQDVLRLQRDVTVGAGLYATLSSTLEELKLVKAGKAGNVRLIDSPAVPEDRVRPRPLRIIAASLVLGLFVGIMTSLARLLMFDAIDDPHEVELRTGLPVYASVPYSRLEEKLARRRRAGTESVILAQESKADHAIESLRGLRATLEFAMLNARNRMVLISGPTPGVGMSFIALNLAAIMGAAGKRVLLVDADMRRGLLHRHVGGERGPGLSDLIQGASCADDLIRSTALAGVDFLPVGSVVSNPSDVLSTHNLQALASQLSAAYDVVLLDAPPVLSVPDASQLASLSGTTLLVARQGMTGLGELRESIRRFAKLGVTVRGVIVNGQRLRPGRYSYDYGRYRYSNYTYKGHETEVVR
ncbi:exopolysaccharide transport family protein [Caballeronia temeraria]|uniref:Exopolysaccharide transport family protein n=1 Tax=Caballeronia temeraria TaxID=1777137 RepID=A0A157ZVT0_9BURK|nr:GNVR domain-containing protein [Caballeronia temeraria]SAK49610.1 exopolysaccharide transport family protein [Caballeronia temeraria]